MQRISDIHELLFPSSKRALAREALSHEQSDNITKLRLEELRDPLRFSKELLGFEPFEYQAKILKDSSKRIVACAGRQVGKSVCVAAKAIHFAVYNDRTNTLIVSASLRQSMLMFEKIVALIESKLSDLVKYRSRIRVRLSNGSSIIALPSGRYGHTLRGFTADLVIVDEAAFVPEEVIVNSLLPTISTTDGYCWMLSTPYDRDHVFYKAFNDPAWSVYHLPSSVNPLISKEFLEEQKHFVGELRYLQEYEAQFVDDVNAYYPMTLLRQCIDNRLNEMYEIAELPNGYAGYDPGGRQDPAALIVVNKDKNGYAVRYAKTWLGQEYTTTDFAVAEICRKMRVQKIFVDQTGLGNPILEHMAEIYQKELVEGIFLTQKRKEEILLNLKLLFEQKLVRLPDDRELLASLNCIMYERTHVGNYTFKHRQGTHDDLAYALALSVWTAKEDTPGIIIKV